MGSESSVFVARLQKSIVDGRINEDIQSISDDIGKSGDAEASKRLMDDVLIEAQRRGMMPSIARAYATKNFVDLDLNGDGYIGSHELQQITNSQLLAKSTNALEKGILRYMSANVKEFAAAHNDIVGGSQRISKKDLQAFDEQSRTQFEKTNVAQSVKAHFGTAEQFARLSPDRKGRVSEAQLRQHISSGKFSPEQTDVLRSMLKHRPEICKMSNDEFGFESKITLKDIEKFAEKYTAVRMVPGLVSASDFKAEAASAPDTAKGHLPDVILEFGKRHFNTLDHDGNGFISRAELRKILETTKWSRSLGPESTYVLKEMDSKLEQIANSSRDEWGRKDTKGISTKDLENYAEHQRRNRSDIPNTPGDHKLTLTIGGINREYIVHIPPGYDGKTKLPVVDFYPYFTGDGDKLADYTGMSKKADKENFIVVYPRAEGYWNTGKLRQWGLNSKPSDRVDEMAFVEQLMNHIDSKLAVDKSRRYVVGYSNGGMFAHEVATKFSDRIAGMVSVAGCLNGSEKMPSAQIPVMMINGTSDWLVPYNGRRFTPLFPRMLPSDNAVNFWKQANQADNYSQDRLAPNVRRETYSNPKTGTEVVRVTMQGNGHGWPGSNTSIDGNLCTSISGTDVAWDFLKNKRKGASVDSKYDMDAHLAIARMLSGCMPALARR